MVVALREMSEYEQPRPGLGRDAAGLPGGQASRPRARATSASAKVDSHTSMSAPSASSNAALYSRVSMTAPRPAGRLGSLTCSTVTRLVTDDQVASAPGSLLMSGGNAEGGELSAHRRRRLYQPVTDGRHGVRQRAASTRTRLAAAPAQASHWPFPQADRVAVQRRMPERVNTSRSCAG